MHRGFLQMPTLNFRTFTRSDPCRLLRHLLAEDDNLVLMNSLKHGVRS